MIDGRIFPIAKLFAVMAVLVSLVIGGLAVAQVSTTGYVRPPSGPDAQKWGEPAQLPTTVMPQHSDPKVWRDIRFGVVGTVSIPDKQAGQLIQSVGVDWVSYRNDSLRSWGARGLAAILVLLVVFFVVRGRIRVDSGLSGRTVQRFNFLERFAHWLTAGSFIILALTGLNMLYGRQVLLPILGLETFSTLTNAGKYAHAYLAFAFMAGVILILLLWVRHNLPDRTDLAWIARGGGLLVKGSHPPARKFNVGQKMVFWVVILGGISISLSGLALMFPFTIALFADSFAFINLFGFDLPTDLTMLEEMQLSQVWHAIVGLIFIIIIIAHIYIGSIGMEGAFDAMGSGMVDENWAREHHSLWLEETTGEGAAAGDEEATQAKS